MWGIRPKGLLGGGRKAAAAVLLLTIVGLFAAILVGGGVGSLSMGAYEIDFTILAGVMLLSLGVLAAVLRRPPL